MKHMFLSSTGEFAAFGSASWNFSTGSDSPVSVPWLTNRSFADRIRTSPGIMSPADRLMMSPGTRSRRGSLGLAITDHSGGHVDHGLELRGSRTCTSFLQESERDAEHDHASHDASGTGSPVAKEIDERTASKITSGLRRMIKKRINQPRCRSCATSFGPAVRARESASLCVRPAEAVRNERSNSSPSFPAASRTAGRRECYVALPSQGFETHPEQEESQ